MSRRVLKKRSILYYTKEKSNQSRIFVKGTTKRGVVDPQKTINRQETDKRGQRLQRKTRSNSSRKVTQLYCKKRLKLLNQRYSIAEWATKKVSKQVVNSKIMVSAPLLHSILDDSKNTPMYPFWERPKIESYHELFTQDRFSYPTLFPDNHTFPDNPSHHTKTPIFTPLQSRKDTATHKKVDQDFTNSITQFTLKGINKNKGIATQFTRLKTIYSLDQLLKHLYDLRDGRRVSPYKLKLEEQRKLSVAYGKLSKKSMRKLLNTLKGGKNVNRDQIWQTLESRLDIAMRRCFLYLSLRNIQNWIALGKISVNKRVVKSSSYQLKEGDVISINKDSIPNYKELISKMLTRLYSRDRRFFSGPKVLAAWKRWAHHYTKMPNHYTNSFQIPKGNEKESRIPSINQTTHLSRSTASRTTNRISLSNLVKQGNTTHPKPSQYQVGTKVYSLVSKLSNLTHKDLGSTKDGGNAGLRPRYQYQGNTSFLYASQGPFKGVTLQQRNRKAILVTNKRLMSRFDLLYPLRQEFTYLKGNTLDTRSWLPSAHDSISIYKPVHMEISWRTMTAIYLYRPQLIIWPFVIDLNKIYPG